MWILDIEGQRLQTETEERESPTAEQRDKTQTQHPTFVTETETKVLLCSRPSVLSSETNKHSSGYITYTDETSAWGWKHGRRWRRNLITDHLIVNVGLSVIRLL